MMGEFEAGKTMKDLEVASLTHYIEKLQELRQESKSRQKSRQSTLPQQFDPSDAADDDAVPKDDTFDHVMTNLLDAFSPELSLQDVLERMVRVPQDSFKLGTARLFTVDMATEPPSIVLSVAQEKRGMRLPLTGLFEKCVVRDQIINIPDARAHPEYDKTFDIETGVHTKELLCIPVHEVPNHVAAILVFINSVD